MAKTKCTIKLSVPYCAVYDSLGESIDKYKESIGYVVFADRLVMTLIE